MIIPRRQIGPHSAMLLVVRGVMKVVADVTRLLPAPCQSIFPIKDRSKGNFTQIESQILERKDLSFRAKGILLYLLSRPTNWTVRVSDLIKRGLDGKQAVRGGLKELERAGYIRRSPGLKPRQGDVWEVFEDPRMGNRIPQKPLPSAAKKIHRITARSTPFTQIANAILINPNLHFKSKGILAYFLSKPSTWRVRLDDVERHGTEGREAIRSSVTELEHAGFLQRHRGRNPVSGKLKGFETYVFEDPDNPKLGNPTVGLPTDGKPSDGSPTDGNPAPIKKEHNNKENKKFPPKSPRPGGFSSDSFPGNEEVRHRDSIYLPPTKPSQGDSQSSAAPTRIMDLPDDQILKPAVTMSLVKTDPLARKFHQLFPNQPWTQQLARKFCKRVRSGMITHQTLEVFRWSLADSNRKSFRISKMDILDERTWKEQRARLLPESKCALASYCWKLEQAKSDDPASVPVFFREFREVKERKPLSQTLKDTEIQPATFLTGFLLVQRFLAAFAVSQYTGEVVKFSCCKLPEEDKKMLLMEIIGNGVIFSLLDELTKSSDWSEAIGWDWHTVSILREKYIRELEEMIDYLSTQIG